MDWSREEIDRYQKAEGKGIFKAETTGAVEAEEPEFAVLARDAMEIAFEAEYSG